jgi:predicted MFS family arabinose efflux permease
MPETTVDSTSIAEAQGVRGTRRALGAVYVAGGVSALGTQMTMLALPWLVLESTGSATRAGVLFALQVLPMALLGFAGGEVIQRFGARRTMVVSDAARAVVIALVPVLSTMDVLSFGVLLAVVVTAGVLGVPYFAAQRVLAADLAGPDPKTLTRANSLLEGGFNVAAFAGPAIGGVLITLVGAERVLWFDAASLLLSCLLLWRLVPRGQNPSRPRTGAGAGVLAGVRALRADEFLRPAMASTVTFGFLLRILGIALPLLAFQRFGGDARVGGLLLAGFGAGALAGSLVSYLVASRLSPARLMGVSIIQLVVPLWLLLTPAPVPLLVLALAVSAAALPMSNAPFFAILATRFPDGLRAKVIQAVMTISSVAGPLGFLAGGVAIDRAGLTTTLVAVAALSSLAAVNVLRALRRLDGPAAWKASVG